MNLAALRKLEKRLAVHGSPADAEYLAWVRQQIADLLAKTVSRKPATAKRKKK